MDSFLWYQDRASTPPSPLFSPFLHAYRTSTPYLQRELSLLALILGHWYVLTSHTHMNIQVYYLSYLPHPISLFACLYLHRLLGTFWALGYELDVSKASLNICRVYYAQSGLSRDLSMYSTECELDESTVRAHYEWVVSSEERYVKCLNCVYSGYYSITCMPSGHVCHIDASECTEIKRRDMFVSDNGNKTIYIY